MESTNFKIGMLWDEVAEWLRRWTAKIGMLELGDYWLSFFFSKLSLILFYCFYA